MSRMTPELSTWMDAQIARGCTPDSLIAAMQKVGHPLAFATEAVQNSFAARDLNDAVLGVKKVDAQEVMSAGPTIEIMGQRLTPDEVRTHIMNSPNAVDASDRHVHVLFAMASPRVVLFGNLLSDAECDALIAQSQPKLERSTVVDRASGNFVRDEARSSEGTYFNARETELIATIERRVAEVTGIPEENQEPLQILHYGIGGEYEPHFDYFEASSTGEAKQLERGGQRIATLIMYLNDVDAGGATLFPTAGIETKPRRGSAVYFENLDDNGQVNPQTLHAGAPVGRGEKWIATKWIRENAFK
jgi:prolyl 4-hydroxylase